MSKFNTALIRIANYREDRGDFSIVDVENIARSLDNFTEINLVDVCGESIVISAKDPHLKSRVAIKVMLPVPTEKRSILDSLRNKPRENVSEHQRRFVRSVTMQRLVYEIIKKENLQNICCVPLVIREIYKTMCGVDCFAYVMEYVEHVPLIKWCQSRSSDIDILNLFKNMVATVMHCFHGRGIIHTDLKISNILVASDRPCFIDFGFCKNLNSKEQITTVKTAEMHSGVFSSQRQRAFPSLRGYYEDVFSLGILLWCMLSRQEPISYDHEEKRLEMLFPSQMLPKEWRQFFTCCVDEEKKVFSTIVQMYQEFDRIYKDYRSIVIKNTNSIGRIDKQKVLEGIHPNNRMISGALIDIINNIGGTNE